MLANGLFHAAGAVVDGGYVPGLVTAGLLYLPYSGWVIRQVVREANAPIVATAMAVAIGALPMAIHGYLILFRGSRLL